MNDRQRALQWLTKVDIGARGAFNSGDIDSLAALLAEERSRTVAACTTLVEGMKGVEHWVIVDHVRNLVPSSPSEGDPQVPK